MLVPDGELAKAFETLEGIERLARAALDTENLAERDNAVILLRHVTAGRKTAERWITMRAVKAQKLAAAQK